MKNKINNILTIEDYEKEIEFYYEERFNAIRNKDFAESYKINNHIKNLFYRRNQLLIKENKKGKKYRKNRKTKKWEWRNCFR